MPDLKPWRGRVLWLALGSLLSLAGVLTIDGLRGSETWDTSPRRDIPPRPPEAGVAPGAIPPGPLECYLGVVLARETVEITAEIEGHVDQVWVRLGDIVERGRLIATLDTRPFQHQLAIERAAERAAEAEKRRQAIEVSRAEQEYQRRLALKGLLSEEDKEKSRFQRETAAVLLEKAEAEAGRVAAHIAQLEATLAHSEIRAPFAGTVAHRYLDQGATVSVGTPVIRLISSGSYLVRFAVPPEAISEVPIGTPVRVEMETLGLVLDGAVEQLAPEIDAASQMVFVESGISLNEAADRYLPSGTAARVSVATRAVSQASCLAATSASSPG